jgi:hypothetical protein
VAEEKKRRAKLSRVLILFGLAFLLIWACGAVIVHVMVWRDALEITRDSPDRNLTPQPLTDGKVADLTGGSAINQYGYTVSVPWAKVLKEEKLKTFELVSFSEGASMTVWDPASSTGTLVGLANQNADLKAAMQGFYGVRTLSSNYEFLSAQLRETDADISLLHSNQSNKRAMLLLALKPTPKATVIYELPAGRLHGFQIGDPQVAGTMVRLLLFDDKDRELQVWIRGPKTGPGLTQEQINGIVASVQTPA